MKEGGENEVERVVSIWKRKEKKNERYNHNLFSPSSYTPQVSVSFSMHYFNWSKWYDITPRG